MSPSSRQRSLLQSIGPGILFAGAAVGVSHLVQSTRAGALHGLALIGLVLAANLVKYPAFSFGPRYAAATGTSLLEGYRRQGRWALWLYGLLTLGTMFTVQGAVTLVTAALLGAALNLQTSPLILAVGLTLGCILILRVGRFHALDRLIKGVVGLLTVLTLAATALVLPRIEWSTAALIPTGLDGKALLFLAGLVGWMPSAIDVSVWHSLWTLAKRRDTGHAPSVREALLDFNIGYIGTAVLAVCFVFLGAGVIHPTGAPVETGAVAFANQVISLYIQTLGHWAGPLIGLSALLVMFSTTLTVIDGFPRALATLFARFKNPERQDGPDPTLGRPYSLAVAVLALGSLLLIGFAAKSLKSFVDLATTLSFLTAPMLSILNHRAMHGPEIGPEARPSGHMRAFSVGAILVQSAFALWYLNLRFGSGG